MFTLKKKLKIIFERQNESNLSTDTAVQSILVLTDTSFE